MVDESIYRKRIKSVSILLDKYNLECILLNKAETIKYLTGANNMCSWLFITRDNKTVALVLESDYKEYSKQSIIEDIRTFRTHEPIKLWRDLITEFRLQEKSLAIEQYHLRIFYYVILEKIFGSIINLDAEADFIVDEARCIKEKDEIEKIKNVSTLALKVMNFINNSIKKDESEIDLLNKILNKIYSENKNINAQIFIGTDERSALAHNQATNKKIKNGPVIVDLHLILDDYCTDMARTFFLNDRQRTIYEFFKDKVHKYMDKCKDGQSIKELKNNFYKELKRGLDKEFNFLTGPLLHGVGIKVYEFPHLAHPFITDGFIKNLKEGMVLAFTNIGVYSKNGWGIRYEETFLVTKNKPVIFTLDNL